MSRRRRHRRSQREYVMRYTWKHVMATCEAHGIEVTEGRTTYTDTGKKCHGGRIYVSGPNIHEGVEYHFEKDGKKVTWLRCKTGNPGYLPLRHLMDDLKRGLDDTIEAHMYQERWRS